MRDFFCFDTKARTPSQLFPRNQFTSCEENFLKSTIIPDNEIGIHQAVSQLSLTGGQKFIKCDYLKKCTTNRCKCQSENVLCNSRCLSNLAYTNKWYLIIIIIIIQIILNEMMFVLKIPNI